MPYNDIAKYYDYLNFDVDYIAWADYIDKIIDKYSSVKNPNILDFACGTGTIANILYDFGYNICGFDKSEEMIEIAKQKNDRINYYSGKIEELKPDKPFDVVISTFDSINAILDENDLIDTFNHLYSIMSPGGIFIFDVNTEYAFKNIGDEFTYTKDNSGIFSIWTLEYDRGNKIAKLFLTIFERIENSNYLRNDYVLDERIYSLKSLKSMLKNAGFGKITILDHLTLYKYKNNSFRVDFVSQKKE